MILWIECGYVLSHKKAPGNTGGFERFLNLLFISFDQFLHVGSAAGYCHAIDSCG